MIGLITKGIAAWMVCVTTLTCLMLRSAPASLLTFYRFGPQEDLVVIGIVIDTGAKYTALSLFCIMNSLIRSVETDVLYAWLVNSVQDKTVPKSQEIRGMAYQVAVIHSMYNWWDWFICMNILLAQIDLFLMEMFSSVLTSVVTTRMYLQHDPYSQIM